MILSSNYLYQMRKALVTSIFFLGMLSAYGQDFQEINNDPSHQGFNLMESYPKYPGGIEGFFSDLKNNIEMPKKAIKKGIHGSVKVRFVVQTDGSISEISIIESDDKIFNPSAINAIEGLKKWKPGIQKGNPIKVAYQQKINF